MHNQALCIDFGAAYTKVAIRRLAGEQAQLVRDPSLNLDALNACIPTVAACREKDNRWVFGIDAVELVEGNGIRVFRNWKRDLFGAVGRLRKPALEVTFQFFKWLRDDFLKHTLGAMSAGEPPAIRICVPAYALGNSLAVELDQLVREAGWKLTRPAGISEPVTNIIGVLTGGINRLIQDEVGDFPDLRTMFSQSGLLRSIRRQAVDVLYRPDVPAQHTILVIDTGAFTTDFALARFPLDQLQRPPRIDSESVNLGIVNLDEWVAKELPRPKAQIFLQFSARELELFRRKLYSEKIPYLTPDHQQIGDGWEMHSVQGCIHRLAGAVHHALQEFLARHEVHQVHEVILTGGGNHIPGLVLRLTESLLAMGATVVHLPIPVGPVAGAQFNEMLEEVVRGGSALGGVSIVADAWD